jgi:hypothetical protein
MPSKKGKEKKTFRALYLKLESINDLARNMAGEKSYLLAAKEGNSYKLMCEGERIGEGKIIYCLNAKSIGRYLIYSAEEGAGEKVEMVDDVTQRADHYKSQRIPIIEIAKDPYSPMGKDDLKEIKMVEVKDPNALVRALINTMGEEELPRLVSFPVGKERIMGTLALLEGGDKAFAYSKAKPKEKFSNISYDYNSDTLEYTNLVGGTSKINTRVINLAESPLFFKA